MADSTQDKYRVSWRSPLAIIYVACMSIMLAFVWPNTDALIRLGSIAVFGLGMLFLVPVVTVRESGIVLYKVNILPWSRVAAARRVSVLGLPYLVIERHNGFRWWMPLYVHGRRTLAAALAERAPAGNPLLSAL